MRSALVENNFATIIFTYDQEGRVVSMQSEETSKDFEYAPNYAITGGLRLFDAQVPVLVSSDSEHSPSR